MIVMIDNHDSFTYNLIDYLKVQTTDEVKVISVDEVSITKLKKLSPKAIIISPGPGKPSDYPVLSTIISHYDQLMPILGVCLASNSLLNIMVVVLFIALNLYMVIPLLYVIPMKVFSKDFLKSLT